MAGHTHPGSVCWKCSFEGRGQQTTQKPVCPQNAFFKHLTALGFHRTHLREQWPAGLFVFLIQIIMSVLRVGISFLALWHNRAWLKVTYFSFQAKISQCQLWRRPQRWHDPSGCVRLYLNHLRNFENYTPLDTLPGCSKRAPRVPMKKKISQLVLKCSLWSKNPMASIWASAKSVQFLNRNPTNWFLSFNKY